VTSNPFSTRFIRPGAIPFVFTNGQSPDALVQRLREQDWWGQIIGEHGSGKSTLLATLTLALEAAGRNTIAVALHPGEHRLPPLDRSAFSASTQFIIDGYEQLSWWSRRRIKSLCRRHRAGLLVTAHADVGLPTLYQTQPSEELAHTVVARLTEGNQTAISSDDISAAFAAADGDVRETLFKLYDVYQQRR
jgi:energy-coupling factor transporter ATP-binding protein EcfA2